MELFEKKTYSLANQLSLEALEDTYHFIRLKTRHKTKLVRFELFYSANLLSIYATLKEGNYSHLPYQIFIVKEPKYRLIMSESLSDKIVNQFVCRYLLLPVIEPILLDENIATRKGKGSASGISYMKKYIHHLKKKQDKIYILKCDIHKYFYNIDHEILLEKLEKLFLDSETRNLLKAIINSTNDSNVNSLIDAAIARQIQYVKGLHILDEASHMKELQNIPRYLYGKGIPIGNMTSQIFAIFYLNDLDHFIKEKLGIQCYIRYMDDFLLIHPSKEYLQECLKQIKEEVAKLKLQLNEKTQIYEIHHGVNFLGYTFFLKGQKLIMKINAKTKRKIAKKVKWMQKRHVSNYANVKASYMGYLEKGNAKAFMRHIGLR